MACLRMVVEEDSFRRGCLLRPTDDRALFSLLLLLLPPAGAVPPQRRKGGAIPQVVALVGSANSSPLLLTRPCASRREEGIILSGVCCLWRRGAWVFRAFIRRPFAFFLSLGELLLWSVAWRVYGSACTHRITFQGEESTP